MELNEKPEIEESIPEGYWKSKIGIIPDDWKCVKLGSLGVFKKGKGISTKDTIDEGLPAMMYGDIYVKYDTKFSEVDYRISRDVALKSTSIDNGTLLFTCSGETANEIGKCVCYQGKEKIYIGGDILSFKQLDNDSLYLAYLQNGYELIKQKAKLGQGNSVVHIYEKQISQLYVSLPPLKEQSKIASVLSTQDNIIDLKRRLVEEKLKQKKFLIQTLLNAQSKDFKRLNGFERPWNGVQMGEVLKNKVRKISKPSKGYWRLGLRSHGKGTFHEFIANPEENAMEVLYKVKENDLIINITFAWEHAVAIADCYDDDKLVSHRFPTYEFVNGNVPEFFKYFILQKRFKKQLQDISPGGAGRNRVMSKKDFLKLNITIPEPEEQLEIARILSAVDEEIKLLKDELEKQIKKKKSLMQLLLTGKVRTTNMS